MKVVAELLGAFAAGLFLSLWWIAPLAYGLIAGKIAERRHSENTALLKQYGATESRLQDEAACYSRAEGRRWRVAGLLLGAGLFVSFVVSYYPQHFARAFVEGARQVVDWE
jgi:hypothetical protein